MATATIRGAKIAGVVSCTPTRIFDNLTETGQFDQAEVRKVVAMAGVSRRRVTSKEQCSSDLCEAAARELLAKLGWAPETVDGLVLVTQTPDHFLPSTSCLIHRRIGLSDNCITFDVGLGCSGYPYGLYLGSMMASVGGCKRVLVLHGETPTKFTHELDRATFLLFGDAGSATALERDPDAASHFSLATDGNGAEDLIVRAGGFRDRFSQDQRQHYLEMNGANLFTFTIKRVPPVVNDVLAAAGVGVGDIDQFVLHQSNRFMMQHVCKKLGVPEAKVPYTLGEYGNTGGPSVPLTMTIALPPAPRPAGLKLMLVGYGVGLSWGSAVVDLPAGAHLGHVEI
ncbi:MAG TPA: ketoacyl-ACP synthase III [Polyangia bacterium]